MLYGILATAAIAFFVTGTMFFFFAIHFLGRQEARWDRFDREEQEKRNAFMEPLLDYKGSNDIRQGRFQNYTNEHRVQGHETFTKEALTHNSAEFISQVCRAVDCDKADLVEELYGEDKEIERDFDLNERYKNAIEKNEAGMNEYFGIEKDYEEIEILNYSQAYWSDKVTEPTLMNDKMVYPNQIEAKKAVRDDAFARGATSDPQLSYKYDYDLNEGLDVVRVEWLSWEKKGADNR